MYGITLRDAMLSRAADFSRATSSVPIVYLGGVSGSVSYEPSEGDDIDLFTVTERDALWFTLLVLLVKRRLIGDRDLCISFVMDRAFASSYLSGDLGPLERRDLEHLVRLRGGTDPSRIGSGRGGVASPAMVFLSALTYPPWLAAFLFIKGCAVDKSVRRRFGEERGFRVRLSWRYYILDTVKYQRMRERAWEGQH
ncbi:hypothetical protein [Thermogymnomonas acidicola]|uniref:hypothetical protein n=1 Tax=Thermogymnomonas acidicola TaxID=399579 RepID=UPI001396AB5C|nr:hypothetical protein [Thermogymnomonas acidicola]